MKKYLILLLLTSCNNLEDLQDNEPLDTYQYNQPAKALIECTKETLSYNNEYFPDLAISRSPQGSLILAPSASMTPYVSWSAEFMPLDNETTVIKTRGTYSIAQGKSVPKQLDKAIGDCGGR